MDTCIITIYQNYTNCERVESEFYNFIEKIKSIQMHNHLYVCELSKKKTPQLNVKNLHFFQIKNYLNYTECGVNHILNNLPNNYSKVILYDFRIKINNDSWIKNISSALENKIMVQAFKTINLENINFSKYGCVYAIEKTKKIKEKFFFGGVVGYKRKYLDHTKGLFDKCLFGGGELINALPFFYNYYVKLNFLKRVCQDIKTEVFEYLQKAYEFVKENKEEPGYLEEEATFKYYATNKTINSISKYKFSENFYENKNKFYEPLDEEIETRYRKNLTKTKKEDPQIKILSYRENNNDDIEEVYWLSDNNTFFFKNINKVKLYFKKQKDLNYFRIIHNWQELDVGFNDNHYCLELDQPRQLIVISDFFVPKNISESEDTRKLSVYLYKIEIIEKNKTEYSEFSIKKIIVKS